MSRVVHIVDDEEQIRESLSLLLSAYGFQVRDYENGDAFLAGATPSDDDVVLVDVRMPGRNGIEVLADLRARGSRVPVAIMTGHATPDLLATCQQADVLAFLEKPFNVMELVTMLREQ